MAQTIYTKTTEDYQTGEITSRTFLTKTSPNVEAFIRTYIGDISKLGKCSQAEASFLNCSYKYVDYNTNELVINAARRKEICECSGLKMNTINIAYSKLKKKNILIEIEGKIYLNPKLFFYGADIEREKMFRLQIDYRIE